MMSSSLLLAQKRRRAISDVEKKSLRDHYASFSSEKPSYRTLQQWFFDKYEHKPSESTISVILKSSRYERLDDALGHRPHLKKQRTSNWPALELALFEWQQRMEGRGTAITGELLRTVGRELWSRLPQYHHQDPPRFSTGWLDGFKSRFNIKQRVRHGEAGKVNISDLETSLMALRQDLLPYNNEDIYNMDETALYWKRSPDRTLATKQLAGGKMSKARVTANLCCNVDGSHKLPIWFIGTAQKPRCFKTSGIRVENLNLEWRWNKKGWMTSVIFAEYLRWFDNRMGGRRVILLLDNFSAHELGQTLLEETGPLRNTVVRFLPANTTSVCQPLDQGIIKTWKAYYRRQWLSFAVQEWEGGRDPNQTMNVLQAVRWGMSAWHHDVTMVTIGNCWLKARVLGPKYGPVTRWEAENSSWRAAVVQEEQDYSDVLDDISSTLRSLERSGRIQGAMHISNFLNPVEEQVMDDDTELMDHLVACYGTGTEREYETDEEGIDVPSVTVKDARKALQTLRLYEEQQDAGDATLVRHLDRHERTMNGRDIAKKQQTSLDGFFF